LNVLLRPQKDSDLALEKLALRQQLIIWKSHKKRPHIRTKDCLSWTMLCSFWSYFEPHGHVDCPTDNKSVSLGHGTKIFIDRPVRPRPARDAKVIELPRVGGLHHRYEWKEAA
jgi:hypothetical protein